MKPVLPFLVILATLCAGLALNQNELFYPSNHPAYNHE